MGGAFGGGRFSSGLGPRCAVLVGIRPFGPGVVAAGGPPKRPAALPAAAVLLARFDGPPGTGELFVWVAAPFGAAVLFMRVDEPPCTLLAAASRADGG